jgi:hypothetical protein
VKASVLYRLSSGLLLLFAVGHTLGFQQSDPAWGIGSVIGTMQSSRFTVQGFTRTYWDFFLGGGFTVTALYVFAAILAWQLGGLGETALASMRATAWSFAAAFAAVALLSWRYLFWIPIVMSGVIAVCLGAAAWSSRGREATSGTQEKGASHAGGA